MAAISADLFFATIPELNALLVKREISAEELARAFSERLQRLGPRYNALALGMPEIAHRKAKQVEAELKRERFHGPLQGIPYGIKDLISYAGQPTTWGAKPFAAQVFDYNATVVNKLDAAGAVRHRLGDFRLDRHAGFVLRRDGAASHVRPGEPARRDGALLDARQAGPVRA